MSDLQDFFNERKQEIESFIQFVEHIENQQNYSDEIKVLKSQSIIMLYNLIEGTVNKGIEHIFNTVSDQNLNHDQVSQQIRIIWLRYFKLHLSDDGHHSERLCSLDEFINENIRIDIAKFREVNSSYFKGGSLDALAIKNILKKFSIAFDYSEYKLREVKEERNHLAHGEKSFTEIGQGKTLADVKSSTEKVVAFLNRYVTEIEQYITDQSYKAN